MQPIFSPFSKRHERALREKKIKLSFSWTLRKRLWHLLTENNRQYGIQRDPSDNWVDNTNTLSELEFRLLKTYGMDKLRALKGGDKPEVVTLAEFIMGCYPSQVLDMIEYFWRDLIEETQPPFQAEINQIMREERSPWILCDGYFFLVDSQFLDEAVLAQARELLTVNHNEGALQEFFEARNALAGGDGKGAVRSACNAFESTLKGITGKAEGNASALVEALSETQFLEGLPDSLAPGFGKQVLLALPYIGNKTARHGQGEDVIVVSPALAELAVHMAGAFIVFVLKHRTELAGSKLTLSASKEKDFDEDDIPF